MPDPQLIAHPVHQPGHCFTCGSSEGPVVDTMVDLLGEGRIYLCARTCVPVFARLTGWASPEEASGLSDALAAAEERCRELDDLLVYERENKVVAVSDMAALVDRMRGASAGRKEYEPVWEEALRAAVRTCSETKVNGERCTAEALPGRDVCLAHSKRKAAV